MIVAELEGVTKRFGGLVALDAVSLSLEAGTTVALLGPNGAGKSTLASVLVGLRRPDRGRARVAGRDPRDHRARTALGVAPQEAAFPESLRVGELVGFVARHFPSAHRRDDVIERFGLTGLAARQVGGLSVGERRLLAVALAFVGRPALVVLDEPTAGLDREARRAVWEAIRATDAAVLLATHQLEEADALADRVAVLERGRVIADGPVAEITSGPGGARIRYRGALPPLAGARAEGGWVTIDVADAGSAVRELLRLGASLDQLEVRQRSLEEALDGLGGLP